MKNSIFKNYSKKILRSEAFISVIVVFVLAIGIIGTSYALYMDVDKDTDYQLVTVGDLSIGFDNGDNTINLENMTPTEDDIALKSTDNIFSFYIYNTGTYTADYTIRLVTTDGNQVDTKYINYEICKDNSNNCEKVSKLSEKENGLIYKDSLSYKRENDKVNPSSYYFIRIWINKDFVKTNESQNIKLKVIIDATNAKDEIESKYTLVGNILNNNKINDDAPNYKIPELEEKGLYKIQDNLGVSYLFRGATNNNYVNFDNMCFRIVRINGDSSVKLILVSERDTCENLNSIEYTKSTYNELNNVLENFEKNKLKSLDKLVNDEYYKEIDTDAPNRIGGTPTLKQTNTSRSYVGTLTLDEVIISGATTDVENDNYYLSNETNTWTMTKYSDTEAISFGKKINIENINTENYVRPTITLKSNILISNGTGTNKDPYNLK